MVVYPRWRGELNIGNGFAAAASGLSPLARGTLFRDVHLCAGQRFIPAGAGNTWTVERTANMATVYPRWRGEHFDKQGVDPQGRGLSPLARGTLIRGI